MNMVVVTSTVFLKLGKDVLKWTCESKLQTMVEHFGVQYQWYQQNQIAASHFIDNFSAHAYMVTKVSVHWHEMHVVTMCICTKTWHMHQSLHFMHLALDLSTLYQANAWSCIVDKRNFKLNAKTKYKHYLDVYVSEITTMLIMFEFWIV